MDTFQTTGSSPGSVGPSTHSNLTQAGGADEKSMARKAALAALVGTAIEYYEFGVYGYMAATIGPLFFPSGDATASLLAILAVFGSAFLMRPIGGIVLGRLGDRIGRRGVLLVTVIGMGVATAAVGLLPVAATVGAVAPVLLVIIRLMQGFFAGGEVTGAAAYVAESAPSRKRGFYGAFTPVGVAVGGALAAATCGITSSLLSAEQMQQWGWRIPFLLAIPMVLVSTVVRRRVEESRAFQEFQAHNEPTKAPLREVLTQHRPRVMKVIALAFGQNVGYWVGLVFMNIYLTTYLKYDKTIVYWIMAMVSLAMAFLMPFWGALSDRWGRRRVLAIGFFSYMILVWPMMVLMDQKSVGLAALAMFIMALPLPIVQSVGYPTYAEQFPTRVRFTGMAFSFNIGAILGGGLTPYVATSLISSTGNLKSPAILLVAASLFSLIALLTIRETAKDSLA
ncbi:MFS transporter [Collimonas pratensis]|uniref:Sugar (And other) transporter family protein n=1 Tax=Collimonas pratensis TaxID=279113 RepID=A0A127Q0G8_9BURK|nr:MFS transporter [Collimonas pratensis]AMP03496.1 sugar (and other) transporter family protein [Collimonas pratensis]